MASIAIHIEERNAESPRFRAIAGDRQGIGRTMGEALDALIAKWGGEIQETAVLIQRFQPDAFFTEDQHTRMQELLASRASLTELERAELEALIDAELDASTLRNNSLLHLKQL